MFNLLQQIFFLEQVRDLLQEEQLLYSQLCHTLKSGAFVVFPVWDNTSAVLEEVRAHLKAARDAASDLNHGRIDGTRKQWKRWCRLHAGIYSHPI